MDQEENHEHDISLEGDRQEDHLHFHGHHNAAVDHIQHDPDPITRESKKNYDGVGYLK